MATNPDEIRLSPAQRQALADLANESGESPAALLNEALHALRNRSHPPINGSTEHARPIWEEIAEIMADVPEEVLAKLPPDGAEEHDHYIYGTPKRSS